jgi:hypothetical protein
MLEKGVGEDEQMEVLLGSFLLTSAFGNSLSEEVTLLLSSSGSGYLLTISMAALSTTGSAFLSATVMLSSAVEVFDGSSLFLNIKMTQNSFVSLFDMQISPSPTQISLG